MKADVDDRLMDHALRELLRPRERVDLSERIAEAWSRGERGVDLSDVLLQDIEPLPTRSLPVPTPLAPSRHWKRVAAAAAIVATIGFLAWVRWRPTSERSSPIMQLASADEPLRIFRNGQGTAIESTRLSRGDVVVLGDAQATGVTFADRERMVLSPCSVLTWMDATTFDGQALALDRGHVEVATVDHALTLDLGLARAQIEPQSRVEAELVLDDDALACAPIADSAALHDVIAKARSRTLHVRVRVASGALDLTHDGTRERVTSGGEREIWSNPDRLVSAEGEKAVIVQLDEVLSGPNSATVGGMQRAWDERNAALDLAKMLKDRPQYWPLLRERALSFASKYKLDEYSGTRLVNFLLLADTPQAFDIARDLWLASPMSFREHAIVALADRGAPELEREVRTMVARCDPATDPVPALAAASLAIRGNREATELLSRFLADPKPPTSPEEFDGLAIAAYTLDAGGDAEAWSRGVKVMAPYIEDLLRRGAQPAAGNTALALRFLHEARRDRRLMSPGDYMREIAPYVVEHQAELATAGDVRAELERLKQ